MKRSRSSGIGKAFEKVLRGEEEEERAGLSSVLMSPIRQNLLSYLSRYPGSTLKTISSGNGISQSTASWHLRQLSDAGYVSQKRVRSRVIYYPTGLVDPEDSQLLELLNNIMARDLLLLIMTRPGLSQRELAKTLGASDQAIQRLVRRMETFDLVSRLTDGRFVRYFPSDGLKKTKEGNYHREKEFCKNIVKRLESEGLSPEVIRQTESELLIEIRKSSLVGVLELSVDPYRTILE